MNYMFHGIFIYLFTICSNKIQLLHSYILLRPLVLLAVVDVDVGNIVDDERRKERQEISRKSIEHVYI